MEILERQRISYEEFKQIQEQLKSLQKMENCLSDYAKVCYELFSLQLNEKIKVLYWIRISQHSDDEDFELEILKEELYS